MEDDRVEGIIYALNELIEDSTVPKSVKVKSQEIISILNNKTDELSIKVNKAISILEQLSEDSNIQQYTRTEIMSIVSGLEMINN